jgi:hypothetical protein
MQLPSFSERDCVEAADLNVCAQLKELDIVRIYGLDGAINNR